MGRPIEIMDEDVIRAGGTLVAEDRAVNGTRLWARVGKRGRPDRLMAVWNRHVADMAASVDLARSAGADRVRAETLADSVRAELHATRPRWRDCAPPTWTWSEKPAPPG